ncbi:MAG: hypothetical protein AB1489_32990 [Acidobacteriota bacterium]
MSESHPDGSRRNRREDGVGASNLTATRDNSNAAAMQLMEAMVARENMMRAY